MTEFGQITLEGRIGKGRRLLRPLKADPSVEVSAYRDNQFKGTRKEQDRLLHTSSTLYVGNLSFYTTEEQLTDLFGKCGDLKRVIMGLDKVKRTPCGFCFVEYYNRKSAENCLRWVNGTRLDRSISRLDDRIIRTDWDAGFIEGRQYGRGKTGGQVRDEYRTDYDPGRGGYGKRVEEGGQRKRKMMRDSDKHDRYSKRSRHDD
ncbi:unnamed protein product [Oikopleura dioica]|uniref:Nuclear cap-binding protein subunit 2 n=1 Tax=Oikopleura dioica TaxID=34765 RepID=E4XFN9_OIKDI|nr:unnamed protein product [Oikopleura dioica]